MQGVEKRGSKKAKRLLHKPGLCGEGMDALG